MSNTQSEALRLADWLDADACDLQTPREAAAELRRLHEENQKLQQQLGEAVWNYGEKVRANQELLEALKLALTALEESLEYVEDEAENAQRLYGQYPTRQARIQGLKDDARKHMDAITAIRAALAEQPAQQQEHLALTDIEIQNCFQQRSKDKTNERRLIAEQIIKTALEKLQ